MKSKLLRSFPLLVTLLVTGGTLKAESADALITEGDYYYAKLQANESLRYYLPAEKLEPNNVRLLVHISREYRHLMSDATSPEEKLRLGGIAIDYEKGAGGPSTKDPQ